MQFSWVYSIADLLIVILIFHYTQLLLIQMEKKNLEWQRAEKGWKNPKKTGTNNRKNKSIATWPQPVGLLPISSNSIVTKIYWVRIRISV